MIFCYSFALYQLDEVSFRTNKSWLNNTTLLVLASPWTEKDPPLEEYVSSGGKCLSLHPIATKWLGTIESDVVKYVVDKGLVISPLDKLDFAQTLPVLLEKYFDIKSAIIPQGPPTETQQMIGCLIAEPYHQEAFFRNFGQQSADFSIQLTKSFSSTSQDPIVIIRRNLSSKFNRWDYFDVTLFTTRSNTFLLNLFILSVLN